MTGYRELIGWKSEKSEAAQLLEEDEGAKTA